MEPQRPYRPLEDYSDFAHKQQSGIVPQKRQKCSLLSLNLNLKWQRVIRLRLMTHAHKSPHWHPWTAAELTAWENWQVRVVRDQWWAGAGWGHLCENRRKWAPTTALPRPHRELKPKVRRPPWTLQCDKCPSEVQSLWSIEHTRMTGRNLAVNSYQV